MTLQKLNYKKEVINMKTVKNLTVSNIKKYDGFERREDLDFSDDGNRFRGFSYKGMAITTLRSDDTTYLSIRVDYQNNNFTYCEWMKTEEYSLCDKYNGVSDFDIDELIADIETIIAKVNEMNDNSSVDEKDIEEAKNIIKNQIDEIKNFINETKTSFEWWNVKNDKEIWYMTDIMRCMKALNCIIEDANKTIQNINSESIYRQKEIIERARSFHGITTNGSYYMNKIKEYIDLATK